MYKYSLHFNLIKYLEDKGINNKIMKKTIITLLATLLFPTITIADYDIEDNTGEIKFIGEIGGSRGCTITGLDDGIVQMPSIYADELKRQGHGDWAEKTIYLTDCVLDPEEYGYYIELNILPGDASEENANLWRNEGDAQGVGIEITAEASTSASERDVPPEGTDDNPIDLYFTGQDNPFFTIKGRMAATGSKIVAGSVETTISFEISYP